MPDILSHIVCADESIRGLHPNIEQIIHANKSIFYLGAQGPDVFYYYKIFPWQDAKAIKKYADLIHCHKPNDFFIKGTDLLKAEFGHGNTTFLNTDDLSSDLHKKFAYLCGFLSHYALDTTAHPYVFYHSGIDFEFNHKYFECILDTHIAKVYDAKAKQVDKTFKTIKLPTGEARLIGTFLSEIIKTTYNEDLEANTIIQSFKDIKKVIKLMYDPYKLKRSTYRFLDQVGKLKGKMVSAIYPAIIIDGVDYLNLKHKLWQHPCDQTKNYTSSFLDLFEEAIGKSHTYILNLSAYLQDQITKEMFQEVIGNNLYDTGLSESSTQRMQFENILTNYKKELKLKN